MRSSFALASTAALVLARLASATNDTSVDLVSRDLPIVGGLVAALTAGVCLDVGLAVGLVTAPVRAGVELDVCLCVNLDAVLDLSKRDSSTPRPCSCPSNQSPKCISGSLLSPNAKCGCTPCNGMMCGQTCKPSCPAGTIEDRPNRRCKCPSGQQMTDAGNCVANCPDNSQFNSANGRCTCKPGFTSTNNGQRCTPTPPPTCPSGNCSPPPTCPAGSTPGPSGCQCPRGLLSLFLGSALDSCHSTCPPNSRDLGNGRCGCLGGCTQTPGSCNPPSCPVANSQVSCTGLSCQCVCKPGFNPTRKPNGDLQSCQPCPSPIARRIVRRAPAVACPDKREQACPFAGSSSTSLDAGYDCIDPEYSVENCGGCSSGPSPSGTNCLAIPAALSVGCNAGSCEIFSCKASHRLVDGECVARTRRARQ